MRRTILVFSLVGVLSFRSSLPICIISRFLVFFVTPDADFWRSTCPLLPSLSFRCVCKNTPSTLIESRRGRPSNGECSELSAIRCSFWSEEDGADPSGIGMQLSKEHSKPHKIMTMARCRCLALAMVFSF
jgi:hypothetical protein